MAYEDSLYTRTSHYSYELRNNKIRLFPIPEENIYDKIWFQFAIPADSWEEDTERSIGVDGINNINTLPFGNLPYNNINAIGKQWIRRFALSLCKETLGLIRSKFATLPIPGDNVTLNGEQLATQAREEQASLRDELKTVLDELTYSKLMEGDADLFPGLHTNCFSLTKEQMEEASDTDSPQGVLAVCKIPDEATIQTLQEKSGIILAMDAIQDPGNLGTIYRTAAWFGVKAIILGTGTVDLYNSKVVRSTAGATGSVPILTGDLNTILNTFEQSDWKVYLLDGNPGAVSMTKQNFGAKAILVTGNEANGITDSLIQSHRSRMLIDAPEHSNPVESLNAAIATGIALHHVHNSVDNSH